MFLLRNCEKIVKSHLIIHNYCSGMTIENVDSVQLYELLKFNISSFSLSCFVPNTFFVDALESLLIVNANSFASLEKVNVST